MSLSACTTMQVRTGRHAFAVKAGDALLCGGDYKGIYQNPIFICPSRYGKTTEVLKAIGIMKAMYPESTVLAITEYADTPLEAMADLTLRIPWAAEESVCQTRSFSNLYLAAILMADIVAGRTALFEGARRYLDAAPGLYAKHEPMAAGIAASMPGSIVSLGCGLQYGVCIEGAYIVLEMAEFNANYYQLLEYRHGPIVTADKNTCVFILSRGGAEAYERKLAEDVEKTGAAVYVIACGQPDDVRSTFALGDAYPDEITALHYVFCMQSLAFHLSLARGRNPDSPGSLVPFIEI